MNLIKGFATTFKHVLEEPVTLQYPEQMKPFAERFKGRHHLRRYDNGLEKCIGCALCAAACPADAIWVEAAENSDEQRFSPGERYAKTYEINMLRCIFRRRTGCFSRREKRCTSDARCSCFDLQCLSPS